MKLFAKLIIAGLVAVGLFSGVDRMASPDATTTTTTATSTPANAPIDSIGKVSKVVDGDTVHVAFVFEDKKSIRLIGVDTPETVDPRRPDGCYGKEASDFTKSLLPIGTEVRLVYDIERFDRNKRTLAYVYRVSDGLFVNAVLARDGYAMAKEYPPNVAHAQEFRQLETQAKAERKGLWGVCQ